MVSGDYWSYKTCKAPVKSPPPTNQHPVFFTGWMPFLSPVYRLDALPVSQPTLKAVKGNVEEHLCFNSQILLIMGVNTF